MTDTQSEDAWPRDRFDELYVISDIHMGGERSKDSNFQIFRRGDRLAGLVRHIRALDTDRDVALVLNGDIFDTLAEPYLPAGHYAALSEQTAYRIIRRIVEDSAFADVWRALRELLHTKRRHLILVIGNHDVELALPPVQAYLRERLAGQSAGANSRLRFASSGGGYTCHVGDARVYCTHGNEVDEWNKVDFDKVAQLSNAMNAGRVIGADQWEPNAGTRLVIDCMNTVKRQWPFVDLLKPETFPVFGVLSAFDRGLLGKVAAKLPGVLRERSRGLEEVADLLSSGTQQEPEATVLSVDDFAAPSVTPVDSHDENELLLQVGVDLHQRAAIVADTDGTLSVLDNIWNAATAATLSLRRNPAEALRLALRKWLHDDKTFDAGETGELDALVIDRADRRINFIVAGHTHLARAIEVHPGSQYYFNSGTWIRLVRLTIEALKAEPFTARVLPALKAGHLEALDKTRIPSAGGKDVDLVYDRTNVVRIVSGERVVTGALLRVIDGDGNDSVELVTESDDVPVPADNPYEYTVHT